LRTTHRIPPRSPDDFTLLNQQDFLAVANAITNVLTIFLGGIGAISLLVGGIGIMNIMLVSVTERTREIGLRKALGARKADILVQFPDGVGAAELVWAVCFGIALGLGYCNGGVVSQIAASSGTPLEISVTLNSVLLATLFSAAVGVFFGYYPANRAATLAPVEALRYE
jgi:putative ABC transport system permease protein